MLRKLIVSGDVLAEPGEEDARTKKLSLSASGRKRVGAILAFARTQVAGALKRLPREHHRTVLDGLRLYADALTPEPSDPSAAPQIEIVSGYQLGLIAHVTEMHALHYAREAGFGRRFEAVVASALADFCDRLDNSINDIWVARHAERIVGSAAIDGEDLGSGISHLRWFIVDDEKRGRGVGRQLLEAALAFSDKRGFIETHLWTFAGLDAARHLYETNGFALIKERHDDQWGTRAFTELVSHYLFRDRFGRPARGQ